ncbi:hypothetical protein J6590_057113 [Homalodisca vitripennis]|nr:hypothetical protein J6590_057113 [Homalodisca vitripennis]
MGRVHEISINLNEVEVNKEEVSNLIYLGGGETSPLVAAHSLGGHGKLLRSRGSWRGTARPPVLELPPGESVRSVRENSRKCSARYLNSPVTARTDLCVVIPMLCSDFGYFDQHVESSFLTHPSLDNPRAGPFTNAVQEIQRNLDVSNFSKP